MREEDSQQRRRRRRGERGKGRKGKTHQLRWPVQVGKIRRLESVRHSEVEDHSLSHETERQRRHEEKSANAFLPSRLVCSVLDQSRKTHHWLLRHKPLSNLSPGVGSNSTSVHGPRRDSSDLPGDEPGVSVGLVGVVLDSVAVEVATVGLSGVDVGKTRDGLSEEEEKVVSEERSRRRKEEREREQTCW